MHARRLGTATMVFLFFVTAARAAEVTRLSEQTWDGWAPQGKEVDAIYGDYVLRNDRLVCVVADPIVTRNANMTVGGVGGSIIDLTRRAAQNDQLSCYYPGGGRFAWRDAEVKKPDGEGAPVQLTCRAAAAAGKPAATVRYELRDGWDYVLCTTTFSNPGDAPLEVELYDSVRADRTFDRSPGGKHALFWVHDRWFRQAYGVLSEGYQLAASGGGRSGTQVRFYGTGEDGSDRVTLKPGGSFTLARRVVPGDHLFQVKSIAHGLTGEEEVGLTLCVEDPAGETIPGADVSVLGGEKSDQLYARGHTGSDGTLSFGLPAGKYRLRVSKLGRENKSLEIDTSQKRDYAAVLADPGYVVGQITAAGGGPTPCKVQFIGLDGTEDPMFGVDSGHTAVMNLVYSHNGRFKQEIQPGRYKTIVSYGPEHDAVYGEITVERGKETVLEAVMRRVVQTPGWVSADFHNHASPSGDNTSSQFGRVQNILCEHVEYAPCTEHNRISTYVPHLKRLGVEHLLGTCSGIELTGSPLPLNHQNAFPLVYKPHLQDGGAPLTDTDPEAQIARLALWDGRSEKLVQQNHPDIGWLFYDRDGDGQADGGYSKTIPFIDVIEVHPIESLLQPAVFERNGRRENNRVFNWLQTLNQGHRITGVVNTDSHYNFHESGFWRNYVKCRTDEPGRIETLDIVRAAEQGHVVMTTAPYLEVSLAAAQPGDRAEGIPGDDVSAPGGKAALHVKVQCANWYDIDRVQVYLNGRPVENLNFTRKKTPERFGDGVVKFRQEIPLQLEADTHVVVFAVGEHSKLGPVQGPRWGQIRPAALSNPIWVDVDGGGFQANGDTLGAPLPVKGGQ